MPANELIARLRENIRRVFFGRAEVIDRTVTCLLARGHLLIEDVPGVGKTLLASGLARSLDCSFSRIQLTPDMLPSDVLGVSVLDRHDNGFVFHRGPIFANVVLADEINRTPPRTQTALLEAMSEATVSIDGQMHVLDQPFMVVATQNPSDFAGTYQLPENQLDRFLMRITIGYPSAEAEARVLEDRPLTDVLPRLAPVLSRQDVLQLQDEAARVRLDPSIREYVVRLAHATREHPDLHLGLSPRGSLALAHAARATALLAGRDFVVPEDIQLNIPFVCAHRVITGHGTSGAGSDATVPILDEIKRQVPIPT